MPNQEVNRPSCLSASMLGETTVARIVQRRAGLCHSVASLEIDKRETFQIRISTIALLRIVCLDNRLQASRRTRLHNRITCFPFILSNRIKYVPAFFNLSDHQPDYTVGHSAGSALLMHQLMFFTPPFDQFLMVAVSYFMLLAAADVNVAE